MAKRKAKPLTATPLAGGDKVHPSLKSYFGYCLYKSAIRMRTRLDEAFACKGLIAPQIGVLGVLKDSSPLSQISLGGQMGIDKATMVKLLDDLEAKGVITRTAHAEDRRVKEVQLTAKGRALVTEVLKLLKKTEDQFMEHLSASEQKSLRELMPKLLR